MATTRADLKRGGAVTSKRKSPGGREISWKPGPSSQKAAPPLFAPPPSARKRARKSGPHAGDLGDRVADALERSKPRRLAIKNAIADLEVTTSQAGVVELLCSSDANGFALLRERFGHRVSGADDRLLARLVALASWLRDAVVDNDPVELVALGEAFDAVSGYAGRPAKVQRAYELVGHALRYLERSPGEAREVTTQLLFRLTAADHRFGLLDLPRTASLLAKVASSTSARSGKTGRGHKDARDTLARMMEKSRAFDVVSMKDARARIDNARKRHEKE